MKNHKKFFVALLPNFDYKSESEQGVCIFTKESCYLQGAACRWVVAICFLSSAI